VTTDRKRLRRGRARIFKKGLLWGKKGGGSSLALLTGKHEKGRKVDSETIVGALRENKEGEEGLLWVEDGS